MATTGGARVLGLEAPDRLARSRKAGRPDNGGHGRARETPLYDPISHLVYVTRGDDVRTTSSTAAF